MGLCQFSCEALTGRGNLAAMEQNNENDIVKLGGAWLKAGLG